MISPALHQSKVFHKRQNLPHGATQIARLARGIHFRYPVLFVDRARLCLSCQVRIRGNRGCQRRCRRRYRRRRLMILVMMKVEVICPRGLIKLGVCLSKSNSLVLVRGVRFVFFCFGEQMRCRNRPVQVKCSFGLKDRKRCNTFLLVDSDRKSGERFPKGSRMIEMIKQSRGIAQRCEIRSQLRIKRTWVAPFPRSWW